MLKTLVLRGLSSSENALVTAQRVVMTTHRSLSSGCIGMKAAEVSMVEEDAMEGGAKPRWLTELGTVRNDWTYVSSILCDRC